TDDFCNGAGICAHTNNTAPCDDGSFCNGTDTCGGGTCGHTGDPCTGNPTCSARCDEAADSCNLPAGAPCHVDDNPCTDDVCDGSGTCTAAPNTDECDDGLFCTTADRCVDSACIGSPTCPQTDACSDTCDEAADACRTCGHPFSNDRCVVNASFVLQGALGLRVCELCTCDVDSNGRVNTTDALK